MAIAYGARVGSKTGTTQVSSDSVTTTASVPAGALILVTIVRNNFNTGFAITSVTDGASNTYSKAVADDDGVGNTALDVWFSVTGNALASGGTVTVNGLNLLASGPTHGIAVDYLTGAATASVTDGTAHNHSNASPWATPTITTTNAADLLWVAFGCNQDEPAAIANAQSTPNSGWTMQTGIVFGGNNGDGLRTAYQVVSATGTYKGGGTLTVGNEASYAIVAFKAAAGGGGSTLNQVLSDAQSGLDSPLKAVSKLLLDSHSAVDSWTKLFTSSHFDALSATDALVKAVRALRTDAFSLIDLLSKTPAKPFLEWTSGLDSATTSLFTGNTWTRNISDAHSALDVLVKRMSRYSADTWSALDTFSRLWVAHLLLADAAGLLDSPQKQLAHKLADTQSGRDLLSTLSGSMMTLSDAHSATDQHTSRVLKALAEALSATDVQTRRLTKLVIDSLSETDRVTAGRALFQALLDAFSGQDGTPTLSISRPKGAVLLGAVATIVASIFGITITVLTDLSLAATVSLLAPHVAALLSLLTS